MLVVVSPLISKASPAIPTSVKKMRLAGIVARQDIGRLDVSVEESALVSPTHRALNSNGCGPHSSAKEARRKLVNLAVGDLVQRIGATLKAS
jgi:hypothetical protein